MSYRNQPPPLVIYDNVNQYRETSSDTSDSSLPPLETRESMNPPASPHIPTLPATTRTQAPLQSAAQPLSGFQEREPTMPPYPGPLVSSKLVKIKPMDKNFGYDGTGMTIEKFIKRYEDAGETDGASARDLAKQIIPFIKGLELQEEIEDMSGYEERNWELLKTQLLNRFGSSLPLVKYTRQDLKLLISAANASGGIKTLEQFKIFRTKFESITHYLVRMGYSSHLEESRELLLEALHEDLESAVTRELIRDNKMLTSKDGGDILPDTNTLISYIVKEVQTLSVMERRQFWKESNHQPLPKQTKLKQASPFSQQTPVSQPTSTVQPPSAPNPPPYQTTQEPSNQMKDLVRKFESFTAGRMPPPHLPAGPPFPQRFPGSSPYYSGPPQNNPGPPQNYSGPPSHYSGPPQGYQSQQGPYRNPTYKCFYCFQLDHPSYSCQIFSEDEKKGAVKKNGRDYYLPDNTPITWDPRRPVKSVVDNFKPPVAAVTTSFGQLEEVSPSEYTTYEADLGKRTRSGKEYEEAPTSGKKGKQDHGSVMDVDDEIFRIANTPLSELDPSPQSSSSPSNKVRFQQPSGSEKQVPVSKEKPVKKTYLEKPLAKAYPGVEEDTAERILAEGQLTLTIGQLLAVSDKLADAVRKKISSRRVPIGEASSNAVGIEKEEEEDAPENSLHYSCPLGYVNISINDQSRHALLDTGSMVNIIPLGLAQQLGLLITEKVMNLKGIGGHMSKIIGVAEKVPVYLGTILVYVHLCVAEGDVQFVLGKPFLIDASANIKYDAGKGESLAIKDSKGQTYLVPIAHLKKHRTEPTLPANLATKDFLSQGQDFPFNP
ncbi:hypothetical protein PSTG_17093 [Puccinia striiformis f. sp. tritici PST-78]|uniref:Uncharacterized protein n=1 Tax=Puccinia striiformis f. sp. tritici PST-78 TaxID=1165861 RepID=A0A0L0UQT5_9BASI|nr:hypothetical protein PSTG_17093 [Puccinia striiformis f. sp. tritici PST-78]